MIQYSPAAVFGMSGSSHCTTGMGVVKIQMKQHFERIYLPYCFRVTQDRQMGHNIGRNLS